jgi:hypothetical protein
MNVTFFLASLLIVFFKKQSWSMKKMAIETAQAPKGLDLCLRQTSFKVTRPGLHPASTHSSFRDYAQARHHSPPPYPWCQKRREREWEDEKEKRWKEEWEKEKKREEWEKKYEKRRQREKEEEREKEKERERERERESEYEQEHERDHKRDCERDCERDYKCE